MTDEIAETIDWRGEQIDCNSCQHRALLKSGKCELGRACVVDRYARRIDRFFDWNPNLAIAMLAIRISRCGRLRPNMPIFSACPAC